LRTKPKYKWAYRCTQQQPAVFLTGLLQRPVVKNRFRIDSSQPTIYNLIVSENDVLRMKNRFLLLESEKNIIFNFVELLLAREREKTFDKKLM
jgi:hypothetical protein